MNYKPRNANLSLLLTSELLENPFRIVFALMFIIIPILLSIILSITFFLTSDDTPKVDYGLINNEGKEAIAEIIDIETLTHITINKVHPTIISYRYFDGKKEIDSKFKVVDIIKAEEVKIGNNIKVKVLEGESIIMNLKPYGSSSWLFFLVPILFISVAIICLIKPILDIKKKLRLYKYGTVSKAKVIYTELRSFFPFLNIGKGTIIHYEYNTTSGNSITDKSYVTDVETIGTKGVGDTVSIFVSKDNNEISCVIPKLVLMKNDWNIDFE